MLVAYNGSIMPLDDIRDARLEKLKTLRKAGIDPYPAKSWRTHLISAVLADFDTFAADRRTFVLAGRVMAKREHGGSTFINIRDGSGSIQAYFKQDTLGDHDYKFFLETTDIGDFVEVSGTLFRTKKEEPTLEVEKYRILTKTLLPLPEKWHGLQDVEERFRKRYLDLLLNEEVRERFRTRAKVVKELRNFLDENGFLEVSTPTLQPLYGGASARPFKTHLNALDIDLFMRIAPELYLKRLLVGGLDNVYEFTTNFRNEGMDRDHNPEFFALEFYAAYKDLDWCMKFTEEMFQRVVSAAIGGTLVTYEDKNVQFGNNFDRLKFADLLKEYTGIDYDHATEDELAAKAKALGLQIDKTVTKAGLGDEIFKKAIRPKLVNPTFVTDWPVELLPLAKKTENPDYVGAFQFFAGGMELIKAFSELNDPIDQHERFSAQESNRAKGDEEAQRMDNDYVEALEYGMPPAAGWGLGLDRFIMLLTNTHSIREVILFPLMKPRDN
ncbi:MAG: lysine--tRNA ligase [Patescibacteria group bacterium]